MFLRAILLLILLAYSAFSQSTKLQGVVNDDTGKTPAGLYVVATAQSPTDHRTYSTLTGPNGDYSFPNLPAGPYTICVQSPTSGHLNNCNWTASAKVTATAAQTLTQNISVTQGAIFELRLNDPNKLITPNDLLLGVYLPSGLFQPMRLASSDATGRTYDVAVPLKTSIRLNIISSHLRISDDKSNSLAPTTLTPSATSSTVTFPGQSALHGPPVTFTVTGRK
jgi:hypothetical protein